MGLQPISFNHSDIPPRSRQAILERVRATVSLPPAERRE